MNVKITRRPNKKVIALFLIGTYCSVMAGYGTYAAAINVKRYAVNTYDSFIVSQAKGRVEAQEVTKEVYVMDSDKAAAVVADAAKTGAKAGADDSIKSHLSSPK